MRVLETESTKKNQIKGPDRQTGFHVVQVRNNVIINNSKHRNISVVELA